ncbi:hypothetical protein PMAYCL1PPCAC_25305 [Pristionchus mayeri]|uniref:F-box domain-containing protein n=1 Tax=Pristionchus mayeri TaxID=1317129 RepID=A0AAN5I8L9_9BILA|nr:hypothetical protein PMAYCL1PPCAC_25305 [Pristionchus mayeri]
MEENNASSTITNLPDDCLIDIFARLDHTDLDEISTISGRLYELAEVSRSRSKVGSLKARRLLIAQINREEIVFEMSFAGQYYQLKLTDPDSGLFEKLPDNESALYYALVGYLPREIIEMNIQTMFVSLFDRATVLLRRFDFEELKICSIWIDIHFLSFFHQFLSTRTVASFNLRYAEFKYDLRDQFISVLLAANFESIDLQLEHNYLVNEEFMKDYANSVILPALFVSIQCHDRPFRPSSAFLKNLSKFGTLSYSNLLIGAEMLLPALIVRLRQRRKGAWRFLVTRDIDQAEIDAALEADLEFNELHAERRRSIRIANTPSMVKFRTHVQFITMPMLQFSAHFD